MKYIKRCVSIHPDLFIGLMARLKELADSDCEKTLSWLVNSMLSEVMGLAGTKADIAERSRKPKINLYKTKDFELYLKLLEDKYGQDFSRGIFESPSTD